MEKRWLIVTGIILVAVLVMLFNKPPATGKSIQQIEVVPLPLEEKQIVQNVLVSSEFAKDVPKNEPISIRFFSFKNGQRVWHDEFIVGNQKTPTVYLILHEKYIFQLNENNLCEIIQEANRNGDLGFYSESSKAMLLIKYAKMLKHRDCFGF